MTSAYTLVRGVATLDEVIGVSLATPRFALGLAACFAVITLVLAAVGIYGVRESSQSEWR